MQEIKNFAGLVSILDEMKQNYYLARAISEQPHHFGEVCEELGLSITAEQVTMAKNNLLAFDAASPSSLEALKNEFVPGVSYETKLANEFLRLSETLSNSLSELYAKILAGCDQMDTKFYDAAGYGEFWNEVELPSSIEELFNFMVVCAAPLVPGMVTGDDELKNGFVALSIYDLSDALVVFENKDAMDAFLNSHHNAPDCTDGLTYYDGGWQSW